MLELSASPDAFMYKGHALYHLRDFKAAARVGACCAAGLGRSLGSAAVLPALPSLSQHPPHPPTHPTTQPPQARAFQMGLKASPQDKLMQQGFWDSLTMLRQEQQQQGGAGGGASGSSGQQGAEKREAPGGLPLAGLLDADEG